MLWPKEYISQAKIGIAAPTLSPELLRGVSSLDKEERQRAISQQLLSRQVLQRVVREEKLDPEQAGRGGRAAGCAASVVGDRSTSRSAAWQNKNGLDSFILGYIDSRAERAQRIANRLAYVFVEENSKTRTNRAENTSEVLGQQLQASQERLTQLEGQLRVKKEANMGRLPDPGQRQHADGQRPAAVARFVLHAAADRAGPVEPDRVANRRDASGAPGRA